MTVRGIASGIAKPVASRVTIGGGISPPAGYRFVLDSDGAFLTDADGAYLIEAV